MIGAFPGKWGGSQSWLAILGHSHCSGVLSPSGWSTGKLPKLSTQTQSKEKSICSCPCCYYNRTPLCSRETVQGGISNGNFSPGSKRSHVIASGTSRDLELFLNIHQRATFWMLTCHMHFCFSSFLHSVFLDVEDLQIGAWPMFLGRAVTQVISLRPHSSEAYEDVHWTWFCYSKGLGLF